jgi:hypothetical protein
VLKNPHLSQASWLKSSTLVAAALVFLFHGTGSRAEEFCPASIVTEQHAVMVPKNYQASKDSNFEDPLEPNRLYMVQLFDRNPSFLEMIRADQFKNNMLVWNFRNFEPNAAFWIDCYYTDTEINLAEKLPSNISSCTVHYVDANHAFLEGEPLIKTVECR